MQYYSLNNKDYTVSFETALFDGLAPDGGLYYPETIPTFSQTELATIPTLSLVEIAELVLSKWLSAEIDKKTIAQIAQKVCSFAIPLKKVGDLFVLELFHGETQAFKDVAARFFAETMDYFLSRKNEKAILLTATSGDTGGAMAQAFSNSHRVKVIILFPKDKVSKSQEEQITRVTQNVLPLEVDGNYDDCLSLIKQATTDPDLASFTLTSANSVNIGRIIPQIIYFIWAYAQLKKNDIEFSIPTGNLGNIVTGLFTKKMGLPFKSFIAANNTNAVFTEYYKTRVFSSKKSVRTMSNAMDVGNPSNFLRVLEYFSQDFNSLKKTVKAVSVTEEVTKATIKKVYEKYNYLLDPHTAVAWAAKELITDTQMTPVILSTASPIKFASEIKNNIGIEVDDSKIFSELRKKEMRKQPFKNEYLAFKKLLLSESQDIS